MRWRKTGEWQAEGGDEEVSRANDGSARKQWLLRGINGFVLRPFSPPPPSSSEPPRLYLQSPSSAAVTSVVSGGLGMRSRVQFDILVLCAKDWTRTRPPGSRVSYYSIADTLRYCNPVPVSYLSYIKKYLPTLGHDFSRERPNLLLAISVFRHFGHFSIFDRIPVENVFGRQLTFGLKILSCMLSRFLS